MNCDSGVLERRIVENAVPHQGKHRNNNLFEIRVPADLSYVSVVRRAIDAMGEKLGLSADDRSALRLAVGEACNNAVQYGGSPMFPADTEEVSAHRKLEAVCRIVPDFIEVDVVNAGEGFLPSPGEYRMPSPESMAESGRGLALIELMMDSVEYLSVEGNQVVRMRKRFHPSAARDEN